MSKILAINGSYRDDGITDRVVSTMIDSIQTMGAEIEVITLRDYHIDFCHNCRVCTQQPGQAPGQCVLHDSMQELIDKIEQADGYILAAPTNFGSVTAVFKRFMERLVVYAYWPWGVNSPKFRKVNVAKKKAVLVSSCAAPGILGRLIYGTHNQLKTTAKIIGADTVGTIFTGLISKEYHSDLPGQVEIKASSMAAKLV
jgi:multimeric flavodoxin WrbA